jgi:hypothetical protein
LIKIASRLGLDAIFHKAGEALLLCNLMISFLLEECRLRGLSRFADQKILEWPMDKEGKPCTYIGKGKNHGDLRRFRFRDETTGEEIIVEQSY